MSQIFVLDTHKQPLDPVRAGRARLLLDSGKAVVFKRFPCTIMLKAPVEHPEVHPLRLKTYPGSQTSGIAQLDKCAGAVVWAAELTRRGPAIKHALDERRAVRRCLRPRRTRSRKPRFQNRRPRAVRVPPALESPVANVWTRVRWLARLCPLDALSLELVTFDLQRIEHPELSGTEYQQGALAGYAPGLPAGKVGANLQLLWQPRCSAAGGTPPGVSQRGD
jgi:hypothetical protein